MINKELLYLIFSSASIDRWNDQIRPVEFSEIDKQSHKMIIAWLLAKMQENEDNTAINWNKLISYGVSEFMYRAVVTDLKPPVFHYLVKYKKEEINTYVKKELLGLFNKRLKKEFDLYINSSEDEIERRILSAAHFLASKWEFEIIYNFNPNVFGVKEIKQKLDFEIEEFLDLVGVRRLELGIKSQSFLEICAMLRFQKRWAKTPRIPQTSVLGHMLFTAIVSYLLSLEYKACNKKIVNNFFGALFHDIAESLTRDIISPVKYGVKGLDKILNEYEKDIIEEKLLPLLPKYARDDLRYLIIDEFANKIQYNNKIQIIQDTSLMQTKYNTDKFNGVDGSLIKVADHLGAFMEAVSSINNGVAPKSLIEAKDNILNKYHHQTLFGIDLKSIFKDI